MERFPNAPFVRALNQAEITAGSRPVRDDGQHCNCWWKDIGGCRACGDASYPTDDPPKDDHGVEET